MDMQRESLLKESCDEYMRAHAGSFIAETMEGCQYFLALRRLEPAGKDGWYKISFPEAFLGWK